MSWSDATLYTANDLTSNAFAPDFADDFSSSDDYYLHEDTKEFIKYDLFRKMPELDNDMNIILDYTSNFSALHHAGIYKNIEIVYKTLYTQTENIKEKQQEAKNDYDEALQDAIEYFRELMSDGNQGVFLAR